MKEIKAIIRPARLYAVLTALREIPGMPGFTMSEVRAFSGAHPDPRSRSHGIDAIDSFELTKIESVVSDDKVSVVLEAIARAAHTGNPGDGKVFVYEVRDAVNIRTGEHGEKAI